MKYIEKKPIKRSRIRLLCGQAYYTVRKYIQWIVSDKKYSKEINKNNFSNVIFTHKTPLYRKLKDVDMYLQENKVENLKLAIKKIDGIVIMPGEYFSYWKLIGRTRQGVRAIIQREKGDTWLLTRNWKEIVKLLESKGF